MRVLIAPDAFTGSMTAPEAARAIAAGWARTAPGDRCELLPISDGGPGFVAALATGLGGELLAVPTTGPWGDPASGEVLLVPGSPGPTAYIEIAQAAGAGRPGQGDPGRASSAGVAPLLLTALQAGATRVVVGLGGSLTSDGGAGLLAGLGATATSAQGRDATAALRDGGAGLGRAVAQVDLRRPRQALAGVELLIASDVDVPLLGPRGAAQGFGPQKGADAHQVAVLEESLRVFAHACGRADGKSPAVALGAGAAGGLGFALLHLGGRRVPGIESVLAALGFADRVAAVDLVITGEGSFDWQSLSGKAVSGICAAAMRHGRPVLVLAGQVQVGRREWMSVGVSGAYAIFDPADPAAPAADLGTALADGPALLADLAARAARTWSR